jgi:hypothetical protein
VDTGTSCAAEVVDEGAAEAAGASDVVDATKAVDAVTVFFSASISLRTSTFASALSAFALAAATRRCKAFTCCEKLLILGKNGAVTKQSFSIGS